jgi:two-component system, chemotaxis family, protein-glutamate methylesterase/glutaminase
MAHHDIVVIGASAGGIEALTTLVSGLPANLPSALFVVVHVPPYAVSHLPEILCRAGALPAVHASDGMPIRPGRIIVAPPDRHLLVRQGWVELSRGPRENHSRPAIDPLFRSAARAYGPRVIGVVLSGALYDGSLGLMAVKIRAGVAIVQDPREATIDSMPRTALKLVAADYVLGAADIASVVADLARTPVEERGGAPVAEPEERLEAVIADDFAEQAHNGRAEETTVYTCPDCGGVLWQDGTGARLSFRCHVGHAYAPEILLSQKADEFEAALWSSLRLLKEKATLTRQLAERTRSGGIRGNGKIADRIEEQALLDERYARSIQEILEAMPNAADQVAVVLDTLEEDE